MDSFCLNIHSIVDIVSKNAPEAVKRFLLIQLGHFFTPEISGDADSAIIVLQKLDDIGTDFPKNGLWQSLYGFTVSKFRGKYAIFFQHQAGCDVIVSISDTIIIYYLERPGIQRKLYSILLYCINLILNEKYGCLVHAAVVKKKDCCIMLAGHRGAMKTILVLTLLKHGWDFLSDDKCLLINKSVYMFQPTIPIRAHHFDALPWLENCPDTTLKKFSTARKICADVATRFLHKRFIQPLNRFLNPSQLILGNQLSSTSQILQNARLSDIVILNSDHPLNIKNLKRKELIQKFSLVQDMANIDFALINSMNKLKSDRLIHNSDKLIESNIDSQNFFQLSFPERCNIDHVYQELTRCLRQQ